MPEISNYLYEFRKNYETTGYKWEGYSAGDSDGPYSLFSKKGDQLLVDIHGREYFLTRESSERLLHWYVGKPIELNDNESQFSRKIPNGLLEQSTLSTVLQYLKEEFKKDFGFPLLLFDTLLSSPLDANPETEKIYAKMFQKLGIYDTPKFGTITHHLCKAVSDRIEDKGKFRKDVLDKSEK